MKTILIFSSLVFLVGCSTVTFYKRGATQQQLKKDSYQCEKDMRQSGYFGRGLAGIDEARGFAIRCMQARGYEALENGGPLGTAK